MVNIAQKRMCNYSPHFSLSSLGMWSTSFYLGNFLGPTLAGILVDAWGFRTSSVFFWSLYPVVSIINIIEFAYDMRRNSKEAKEYEQLQ